MSIYFNNIGSPPSNSPETSNNDASKKTTDKTDSNAKFIFDQNENLTTQYRQSLWNFEKAVTLIASKNTKAKAFSNEISRRVLEIMKAHHDLEENPLNRPLTNKEALNSEIHLIKKIRERCGCDNDKNHTYSGNGSWSPQATLNILNNGELTEQMTLLYNQLFFAYLKDIYEDARLVTEINSRLTHRGAGFQINEAMLTQDREGSRISPYGGKFLVPPEKQIQFMASGDRVKRSDEEKITLMEQHLSKLDRRQYTERQLRTALPSIDIGIFSKEYEKLQKGEPTILNDLPLHWESGHCCYFIKTSSPFSQDAEEKGLPIMTGPSGTTDAFLHTAQYLGMDSAEEMKAGTLAVIAWMLPTKDHSLHEIRICAAEYGISYLGGQVEDFNSFIDEDLSTDIRKHMPEGKLPGELLAKKSTLPILQRETYPELRKRKRSLFEVKTQPS